MSPHSHHHHVHAPAAVEGASFSLLRLSALERCLGALVLIACLWAGVYWALQ
jgi:hypothetical protein